MYQLTYDSKILFDPYMQSTAITDAKYTGKSNSVSYLDFTIAPNHPLYNTIEKDKGLVEFYSDNVLKFRGKINEIEIDDYGYKIVSCNSVLQYLNHTRVRSYSTVPGDADLTAPTSVEGYFQWLIDQHNLHVKDASERFEVGVNQGAALDKNDYILRSNDNYPTTLDEINDKVLDSLGGYLFVEYKDDRNILNLYADVHSTNSQIIDFGSNILSISYKENDDELYTVVIPRGGTPEKKEGDTKDPKPINIKNLPDNTFDTDSDIVKSGDCVYSLSATKRYGYREYYYSNNDILDPSNLLKAAVLQLRLQMSPKVTIETKAIDLSIAYPGYEQLNIGDACRVRSARHNLDDYFMLSEMELDLNDPSQTTYTFGDEYVSLVGRQSNYLKQINSSIDRNYEDVNTAMSYGKAAAKLADTANKTADAANNTAVKANDKAQKATEDAFNANTTANNAQSTANTANATATTAKSTADKAQATATDAKTTADSANKAAEDLKKKTVEIDKQVEAVSNAADAASAKADQVRTDLQKQVDANKAAADAASAKADQVRTDLTQQVQNVKSEMDTAVEAAQTSANKAQSAADAAQKAADKANASTADLDKSIKAVDAKAIAAKQAAAEAQSKAENVASDLDSANAVIEQHTTELGELTTKVTNAVKKSDSALSVSTEAKQTATEASTTATSAYADAQTALTQSTTATQTATAAKTTAESASKTASDSLKQSSAAVQTANQISTTLRTEYQTKADADKLYATQSSLKQTSDSITASVSKTYATKDALSALQNVADNAIESWRGTGVPTLTNKPASDWTTDAEKKKHSGDLYYDKSTGKAYRFGSDDGETYTWELNQDTDVTKALEDAANAQTSANNAQASATAANTAAGRAQSTANTAVSNAATAKNAADAAQSSANKAQGDVDKLKIDIPETYATKSSLTQTAESITANVESVKTTANSAVTAASKAQQTADGISANLTKNYQTKSQADTIYATKASLKATSDSISAEVTKAQGTADGAVTAASNAQQTADAVTLNLSKNYNTKAQNDALYATKTSLKATSDSLSANITANGQTAQSAVDKATSLEANLNGFKTTVAETYQTKSGMSAYATNSSLTQTANSIRAQVTEVSNTANGAMSKATTVEQNLNGFKTTVSETYATKTSLNTTNGKVDQAIFAALPSMADKTRSASWLCAIFPTGNSSVQSLPSYSLISSLAASDVEYKNDYCGVINSVGMDYHYGLIRTLVSFAADKTWTFTYTHDDGSRIYVDGVVVFESFSYTANDPVTITFTKGNHIVDIMWSNGGGGYGVFDFSVSLSSIATTMYAPAGASALASDLANVKTTYSTKSYVDQTAKSVALGVVQNYKGADGSGLATKSDITVAKDSITTTVSKTYQTKSGMSAYATNSSLTQTANSIRAQVTEVSNTANGAMSKATTVEQTANGLSSKITEQGRTLNATVKTANEAKSTADSNKATISQVSTTASNALTKASSVEQNLNGFKTTVSQTYGHGSNLWVNPTFDADKPQITSRVNNITAPNGSGVNLLASRDNFNDATSFPVVPGHKYVITAHIKRLNGDKPLSAGIWYTSLTSGNPFDTYVGTESTSDLSDGWMSATWRFSCPNGKSRGCVFFQIDQWHNNITTQWYISNVVCVDVTGLQPAGDYSTKSYVDQTAKSVALGVVQNYKGADGSGLATKSDITVAKDSITTTVSKTYQTKADMKNYATQSQLTQTNDKVTIAFQNSQSVGGQNLLLKTSVPTIVTGSGAANQVVAFYSLAVGSLKKLPVGMYHMQFKIKSDTAGGTAYAQWNGEPWGLGSHKVNIGTTEQTYSVDYYITNNNYPDTKQMCVRLDNAQGNVTIREMKLEPGNSMTPWTAAPEDTINDLTNTVQNQATDIANKVSNDDYTGYVNATNKNLSDIQDSQQHLSDSVNNEIKLRESYIQFGQDASNPYMDMGNSSSPNKMRLTNTKLSFTSNNIEVASVSNDKMRISNAEVLQSFRIGNFVWQPRSDGHMALKYSPEV